MFRRLHWLLRRCPYWWRQWWLLSLYLMTRQGWWPPRLCWQGPLGLVLPACLSGLLFLVVYKKLIEFSVLLFNLTSSFFYRPWLISSFICFPFLVFLCIYMLIKSAWIIYIIKTSPILPLLLGIFILFFEFLLLILMKAHWFLESWRGTQKLRAFPLQRYDLSPCPSYCSDFVTS